MQCPVDQTQLVMTERQGVEIDYCPVCRGIWLDRGELDKILDRAAPAAPGVDPRAVPGAAPHDPRVGGVSYGSYDWAGDPYPEEGDDRRRDERGHPGRRRKRESWLEDLFDF